MEAGFRAPGSTLDTGYKQRGGREDSNTNLIEWETKVHYDKHRDRVKHMKGRLNTRDSRSKSPTKSPQKKKERKSKKKVMPVREALSDAEDLSLQEPVRDNLFGIGAEEGSPLAAAAALGAESRLGQMLVSKSRREPVPQLGQGVSLPDIHQRHSDGRTTGRKGTSRRGNSTARSHALLTARSNYSMYSIGSTPYTSREQPFMLGDYANVEDARARQLRKREVLAKRAEVRRKERRMKEAERAAKELDYIYQVHLRATLEQPWVVDEEARKETAALRTVREKAHEERRRRIVEHEKSKRPDLSPIQSAAGGPRTARVYSRVKSSGYGRLGQGGRIERRKKNKRVYGDVKAVDYKKVRSSGYSKQQPWMAPKKKRGRRARSVASRRHRSRSPRRSPSRRPRVLPRVDDVGASPQQGNRSADSRSDGDAVMSEARANDGVAWNRKGGESSDRKTGYSEEYRTSSQAELDATDLLVDDSPEDVPESGSQGAADDVSGGASPRGDVGATSKSEDFDGSASETDEAPAIVAPAPSSPKAGETDSPQAPGTDEEADSPKADSPKVDSPKSTGKAEEEEDSDAYSDDETSPEKPAHDSDAYTDTDEEDAKSEPDLSAKLDAVKGDLAHQRDTNDADGEQQDLSDKIAAVKGDLANVRAKADAKSDTEETPREPDSGAEDQEEGAVQPEAAAKDSDAYSDDVSEPESEKQDDAAPTGFTVDEAVEDGGDVPDRLADEKVVPSTLTPPKSPALKEYDVHGTYHNPKSDEQPVEEDEDAVGEEDHLKRDKALEDRLAAEADADEVRSVVSAAEPEASGAAAVADDKASEDSYSDDEFDKE